MSQWNLNWDPSQRLRDQGYVAKYRNPEIADDAVYTSSNSDTNFMNWSGKDTWQNENFYGNGGPGKQGIPGRQLDNIRWGYNRPVKPSKLFFATGSYGEHNNNAQINLSGCNSPGFDDCELLFSGKLDFHNHARSYPFNKNPTSTDGWKFFEVKNMSSTTECGLCCQKFQIGLQQ
jgi:hypothetical protein